jgi:hypothetical protein
MRHYETQIVEQRRYVGDSCDGCGTNGPYLVTVVISVHEGEEGGRRDEYDYCDECLIERAPALVAAGSKAPIVAAEEPLPGDDE